MAKLPQSVEDVTARLEKQSYLADRGLATSLYVALSRGRPLLVEGEVGVGKTEVAKAISAALGTKLVRLQCYEGIDVNQALYEWDYARQLLYIRALSEQDMSGEDIVHQVFGLDFLVERPLLTAIQQGNKAVLLIDEIDRADDEFEAFLLEVLAEFQITIPEVGTISAKKPPMVILTSNRTRELHDALKRRCLYHWIEYPSLEREVDIVKVQSPDVSEKLAYQVVSAVHRMREMDLSKQPGIAETIDWTKTLEFLGESELTPEVASETLGSVLKERDDVDFVRDNLEEVTSDVGDGG